MTAEAQFLYLTTTGWKSGNSHEIEIWYVAHDSCFYIVSEHFERSHWVQNIQRQPSVTFRVGDSSYQGAGRVVETTADPALAEAVCNLMDAKYGWSNGLIVELKPAP